MLPMLATAAGPSGLPVDGTQWAYEVKWDGVRVLADVREGELRLTSRSGRDVTVAYPELAALGAAHPDVLLDGEVVVLSEGVPSFSALAERMHVRDPRRARALARTLPVTYVAFDLLRLYGVDLTTRPWQERRDSLERLDFAGSAWLVSPSYDDRDALLAATREQGLEGVVAKRRDSRYEPGVRSHHWRKQAHAHLQACLVGGWRPEAVDGAQSGVVRAGRAGTRPIGALLVGVPDAEGSLRYAGRVGSGVGPAQAAELRRVLEALSRADSPFDDPVPKMDAAGTEWVQPRVVVEVRHLGRTPAGRLRQPVFRGVRSDLDPADVRPE